MDRIILVLLPIIFTACGADKEPSDLKPKEKKQAHEEQKIPEPTAKATEKYECGVEEYNSARDEICGIESFKLARSNVCGAMRYNMGKGEVCGVESTLTAGTRIQTLPPPFMSPEQENELADKVARAFCTQQLGDRSSISAKNHITENKGFLGTLSFYGFEIGCTLVNFKSCEHESFGVVAFNECRHESHGVDQYRECAHPKFGIKKVKFCERQKE